MTHDRFELCMERRQCARHKEVALKCDVLKTEVGFIWHKPRWEPKSA